jgi:hypothetical protein
VALGHALALRVKVGDEDAVAQRVSVPVGGGERLMLGHAELVRLVVAVRDTDEQALPEKLALGQVLTLIVIDGDGEAVAERHSVADGLAERVVEGDSVSDAEPLGEREPLSEPEGDQDSLEHALLLRVADGDVVIVALRHSDAVPLALLDALGHRLCDTVAEAQ